MATFGFWWTPTYLDLVGLWLNLRRVYDRAAWAVKSGVELTTGSGPIPPPYFDAICTNLSQADALCVSANNTRSDQCLLKTLVKPR